MNYLLIWGGCKSADNLIVDALSQSSLKYLFFLCVKTHVLGFNLFFYQRQTDTFFSWPETYWQIHTLWCGFGEWGALITSVDYQLQTANVTESWCEIDWGDKSKQNLSADELLQRDEKKNHKSERKSDKLPFSSGFVIDLLLSEKNDYTVSVCVCACVC